jgi:Tfp pilus assembly protein PilX
MKQIILLHTQRGATLIVALIMLLLFTLMITSAFSLSGTNLKAVGNMQMREDALAAANAAIEQIISSSFTTAPAAQDIDMDLNGDGTTDYIVSIAEPACIRDTVASPAALSSASLAAMSSASTWNTVWSLDATVSDPASGALVRIRSGVRVLLTQAQKNAVCPS